jgi:hypothetical protein
VATNVSAILSTLIVILIAAYALKWGSRLRHAPRAAGLARGTRAIQARRYAGCQDLKTHFPHVLERVALNHPSRTIRYDVNSPG